MENKKRAAMLYIIISVTFLTLLMNCVDVFLKPPYAVKSVIKILLFLIVPMVYYLFNKDDRAVLGRLFVPKKNALLLALALGAGCFAVIVGGYFLLRGSFDFSGITESLMQDSGITADDFIYVSLYISFCNSFLEEFFFRGYAFLTLKKHTGRAFAYIFSAFLFSFYHVGMTLGWMHIFLFILELVGLAVGAVIFNWLNERTETIYPSWLVHMLCNFGINTVGFILFGVFN